jgi:putative endonuclease
MSVPGAKLAFVETTADRAGVGQLGEAAAEATYLARGYRVLARNWRCALGEIDLVVASDRTLVFCEVKTRRSSELGAPYEAVTATKQRRLRALAVAFLAAGAGGAERTGRDVRFDVASVFVASGRPPAVNLFEDAF